MSREELGDLGIENIVFNKQLLVLEEEVCLSCRSRGQDAPWKMTNVTFCENRAKKQVYSQQSNRGTDQLLNAVRKGGAR